MKKIITLLIIVLNMYALNHLPKINEDITVKQVEKFLTSDHEDGDQFGYSVSIDGDYAIIGAYKDDFNSSETDTGSAYIYKKDDSGTWLQIQKLIASDHEDGDQFGYSVSIDGDYIIVGALFGDSSETNNTGSAYIYKKDDSSTWIETQKLTASDGYKSDYFGDSVSIDGDYAVIGADGNDLNSSVKNTGSAYIFKKDGNGIWSQVQKLTASDQAASDYLGNSVSMDGDYIIIGASKDDLDSNMANSGSAYIFKRDNNDIWEEVQKLTASDQAASDNFGNSVSMDGDYTVIGAYRKDKYTGNAYIFKRDNNDTWSQTQKLTASDKTGSDRFGNSVVIEGNTAVIGAYYENSKCGCAYIFKNDENGTWSQIQKISANDKAEDDRFGKSVSMNKGNVVVGAYASDNYTGSSYVFQATHNVDILENNTFIEDLNVTDEDNDSLTFALSGVDGDKFSIGLNATFSFKDSPDYENPTDANGDNVYEVTFVATDEHNVSSQLLIKVNVTDNDDEDGDDMSDKWERRYFGDLNHTGTADGDDDNLTDKEEYNHGTDPTKFDTDGDGISDGIEVAKGDDPRTAPLSITTIAYIFDTQSGYKTFQVTNEGSLSITLPKATLVDAQADRFVITNDACEGVTLAPDEECNVTVSFPASNDESLSTTLNISNVRAFIYNYESLDSESSRRLPPVIDDLNISESMNVGNDYNITFSLVGYDDDYTAYIAFFDCNGTEEGKCGDSYNSSERFDQALDLHPYLIENSDWKYNGKKAKKFHFSYVFTPPSDRFDEGNTTIVARFYYKTDKDIIEGDPAISLIIPGNLSDKYYDTSGRRIEKTVVK